MTNPAQPAPSWWADHAIPPWSLDEPYPRFSTAEYDTRWRMFRSLLAEVGAGSAIVAGHAAGRAEVQFLVNAPVRWESLLVVPADATTEPRLLVQLDNHAVGIAPWSTVPVEATGPEMARRAAELAAEQAVQGAPIAFLGPISERLGRPLRRELEGRTTVDIGPAFLAKRLVKSVEELRWTRYGAALCDQAVATFIENARPGLREDELGAIMTTAVEAAGGQVGICFMATASMRDGGTPVPNQTWSRRRTSSGDLVVFELSAGIGGATGQVLRTISLGDEPTSLVRRLHDVADKVVERLTQAVRPGLPVAELEAIGGSIEEAGFTIVDDLVHGYGGGYLPPHVRTPSTRREDPGDGMLTAGMLLVIQPNVVTNDYRYGVQTGGLVAVTDGGAVSMHTTPAGLLRLAG